MGSAVNGLMWHDTSEESPWEWCLERSVAGFALDATRADATNDAVSPGALSFPLPHRDHPYSMCFDKDDNPRLLTVWMPVNQVTTTNGCMYIVPKQFDSFFKHDGHYHHMQLLQEAREDVEMTLQEDREADERRGRGVPGTRRLPVKTTTLLGFPLAGAKPLAPHGPGTLLCWHPNMIHWGSHCHESSGNDPRAAMALVFRRMPRRAASEQDATSAVMSNIYDPEAPPLIVDSARSGSVFSKEGPLDGVSQRLALVVDALNYFEHWYSAGEVKRKIQPSLPPGYGKENT